MTRVHVPHTLSQDVFMLQKFGLADKATLLRHLPPEDRYWMEAELRIERRGQHKPWYNVPMVILAQLVFKVSDTQTGVVCFLYVDAAFTFNFLENCL